MYMVLSDEQKTRLSTYLGADFMSETKMVLDLGIGKFLL